MAKGAGGFAAIHAARARKYSLGLERVEQALVKARVFVDEDLAVEQRVPEAVTRLADEVVKLRQQVEDMEWESA